MLVKPFAATDDCLVPALIGETTFFLPWNINNYDPVVKYRLLATVHFK